MLFVRETEALTLNEVVREWPKIWIIPIWRCGTFNLPMSFFASGDFLGWTGATVINLQCTGNFSKSPYLFFMALLREEGIAAGRETVNKVCREGKLCPCQHWMLVSLRLFLSLPASPERIKERKCGVFRRQTGASAWIQLDWEIIVQIALHYLTPVTVQWGSILSWYLQIGETEIAEVTSEIHNRCLVLPFSVVLCGHGWTCVSQYLRQAFTTWGRFRSSFLAASSRTHVWPNWLTHWGLICILCR